MDIPEPIIAALNYVFGPKAKGGKWSFYMIRTGFLSFSSPKIEIGSLHLNLRQSADDTPLPDETTVAFHDFFEKRVTVGTKAGAVTIDLAGKSEDQEPTIQQILTALDKNGVLAPLEDKDKKGD